MPTTIRNYTELSQLKTWDERFRYLKLTGKVGADTFGIDRWVNQHFYHNNPEWKSIRRQVILRDGGCDLGIEGMPISKRPIVHHMNPISMKDLESSSDILLDPEYLITVTHETHNAIHYCINKRQPTIVERKPNDTSPWKR